MPTDFEAFNPHAAEAVRLKEQTEHGFVEILLQLQIERTAWVEKLSGWLLLVTGAAFPLLVANAEHVLRIVTARSIRVMLLCLVISALFGVLLKFRTAMIIELRETHALITKQVKELADAEQVQRDRIDAATKAIGLQPPELPMDFQKVFAELHDLQAWPAKLFRRRVPEPVPTSDLLAPLKRAVRMSWYVRPIFILQFAAFLCAALVVALGPLLS